MNEFQQKIYLALPYWGKVLAASLHGFRLRRWRYGPETEEWVGEILERDRWSPERVQDLQREELARVLHYAARNVPYYREMWTKRRRAGYTRSPEYLEHWPILKKDEVRRQPESFVSDDEDLSRLFKSTTSGTTGTPVTVFFRREALRRWYAFYEARIRRWNGVSIRDPWAIIGGQVVASAGRRKPPFWVRNWGLNQLYISSHHVSPANSRVIVEAMADVGVTHAVTYPSSMNVLAASLKESSRPVPTLRCIISNAEVLLPDQRGRIEAAFGCPVRSTYGMVEAVVGASECSEGRMHVWPEVGVLELLDSERDVPVASGSMGRVVATGLLNTAMPLIRYETGDLAVAAASEEGCGCGRGLPILREIAGRAADTILTPDGRRVFWINPVFYGLRSVAEAQVIQETLSTLRVLVVMADGSFEEVKDVIERRLRQRVGTMEVLVERVGRIPRGPNGKFRPVVSRVVAAPLGEPTANGPLRY